jgi:pyruvate kinase
MKAHMKIEPNVPSAKDPALMYAALLEQLQTIQHELTTLERDSADILRRIHPQHEASAANLLHYLALRRRDVRPLQEGLSAAGLSSLGRAESHVLSSVHAMIVLLQHALSNPVQIFPESVISMAPGGDELLERNTSSLLGKPPAQRHVRIMVTLPGEAADDYNLVRNMLLEGMDCARINCAHDTPQTWARIIDHIKQAKRETGRHCRILMDLGGPKIRTGPLATGPAVLKWRPRRDLFGRVNSPAKLWLHPEQDGYSCPAPADACIPIQGGWLSKASLHDRIEFTDARGALRHIKLIGQIGNGFWAESTQTAYIRPGLELHLVRTSASGRSRPINTVGVVGAWVPDEEQIRLRRGDALIVTRAQNPGQPAQYDEEGRLLKAASIACSLPQMFSCVKPGERMMLDDGRIGGVIRSVHEDEVVVEITQARDEGEKLLADKGINLPDSQLDLDGLTAQDIDDLKFIVKHADMVGLSFIRGANDVHLLQQQLQALDAEKLGIVLKIETRAAFEHLPEVLLAVLGSSRVGVMIARGDLAVECGYERLAELQEEILWLAEAAHLPVIWATQVLEGLAKNGKPSRSEITDAAMGERAECVMLNKGPHIIEAIRTLDDILQRMQGHQQKKSALLRRLHW